MTKITQSPNTVNRIISFHPHDKRLVHNWLIVNMTDGGTLTQSNLGCYDADHHWRWRLSKKLTDRQVWLERAEDVAMFEITWCDRS